MLLKNDHDEIENHVIKQNGDYRRHHWATPRQHFTRNPHLPVRERSLYQWKGMSTVEEDSVGQVTVAPC